MAAFAAIAFAANAQTEPTASTSAKATEKKECANKSPLCCAKGAAGTASTASTTPEVKSVSKSKAKKACCAGGEAKAACGEAKAEKAVNK